MTHRWLVSSSAVALVIGVFLTPREARADRVLLVGGTVIDGTATRKGGKVVVQIEAGEISLPANSVLRIEKGESAVSRFEARYAALAQGDVKARLELADYCRDRDMRARERRLLLEVLDLEPNNTIARARLGYVKTEAGWVTLAESMRARGMVEQGGRWVAEAEQRELDQRRREAEAAYQQRDAEAELARKRTQLAADQAALDAQRRHVWGPMPSAVAFRPVYGPYFSNPANFAASVYRSPFGGFPAWGECGQGDCSTRGRSSAGYPTVTPGAFDSTSLSVVKVPYRPSGF